MKIDATKYYELLEAKRKDRLNFFEVLNKVTKVEPTFGKAYFKLDMDDEELNRIHQEFNELEHK